MTQWKKPEDFDNNTTNKRLKSNSIDVLPTSGAQAPQVRTRHILLKHNKSRKPISWRNENVEIELNIEDVNDEMEKILESLIDAQSSNPDK